MNVITYLVINTVDIFISAILFLMFIRAIMSWLPIDDDSKILWFVNAVTEPVIYPVRAVLSNFKALEEFPIDISFLVSFILLSIIQTVLIAFAAA